MAPLFAQSVIARSLSGALQGTWTAFEGQSELHNCCSVILIATLLEMLHFGLHSSRVVSAVFFDKQGRVSTTCSC